MKSLREMNKQEIVNTVWAGFEAQGWKTAFEGGRCRYRTIDGCKCAAGHVLPDEEYDLYLYDVHGGSVVMMVTDDVVPDNYFRRELTGTDKIEFMNELQKMHDFAAFNIKANTRRPDDKPSVKNEDLLKYRFTRFINDYGLEVPNAA